MIYIILLNGQAKPTSLLFNTFSVFSSQVLVEMDEMERVERGLSSNLNWRWVAIQQRQHSCPQPLRMSDPPGVQPHRANVPVCDCLYLYVQVLKSNSSQFPPSRKDGIFVYKYHSPDNSKPSMPLKMLPQNT